MNVKFLLLPVLAVLLVITVSSCGSGGGGSENEATDTLTEAQTHLSENALKGLVVANGLQVQKMASEPDIRNPTNMDIDDRGRIWITEAYNYRPESNGNPVDSAGDRIVILEDRDGDGVAETHKVFYQGPEINAPLGICVLGNRVFVSQSPYVWIFYDDNGDDKADRKEILFQGIHGIQHDHGMHAFIAGPDGKLYFNFGNEGKELRDKNNKPVLDQDGDPINMTKYKMGMAFRCDPDGSHVEVLGNNFRNNYELAVDSYGTIWQSDNDDDGNRGVRINYVMEYGNYGYSDEMTGAYWQAYRVNMEDSIPLRHWHLNDPGVVPNLLQIGSGSPTGMVVYEGKLLPEKFRNQMIHCEAGHNVVRAYPVENNGAGYTATIENILSNDRDQWFRPADVAVAPDGSLVIADWYDPGVGGHGAGDQVKGRLYRVAPDVSQYKVPRFDYSTPAGAIVALQNPNKAAQYNAWNALAKMGKLAVPALQELWRSSPDSRMKARAFWVLVKMPGGEKYIAEAIRQPDPNLRIVGLRAARQLNANVTDVVGELVNDKDPQVRRECAVALHHNKTPEAPALWTALATQYDGKDRWYLEALGIGAADQWNTFFDAYVKKVGDPLQSAATRDIVWRARTDESLPYLQKMVTDENIPWSTRLKYFRAFDFNLSPQKSKMLIQMIASGKTNNARFNVVLLQLLDPRQVKSSTVASNALTSVLGTVYGSPTYLQLVSRYDDKAEAPGLLKMAIDKSGNDLGVDALGLYFQMTGEKKFKEQLLGKDTAMLAKLMPTLGKAGSSATMDVLQKIILTNGYSPELRKSAAENLGKSWEGQERVVELLQTKQLPQDLAGTAVDGMKDGERKNLYEKALTFLPGATPQVSENRNITLNELLAVKPNGRNGERIFQQNCSICHMVKDEGKDFGPKLTEIGDKLPKDALFTAITDPSKSVSFGYETTEMTMRDGSILTGIISNKTASEIELKLQGGSRQKVERNRVKSMKTTEKSMMPELYESMSRQEFADLVEYLSSLRKK